MQTLHGKEYHKENTPVNTLPPHIEESIHQSYSRTEGRQARELLAQGEVDVLESCRQALGWRTVTSLARKYYPLLPERLCWKRALSLCLRYRHRWYTKTLTIRYLLKAVVQQARESLARNFSGKLGDILNSTYSTNNSIGATILNGKGVWGETNNLPARPTDKYLNQKFAHMILR